MARILLIFAHPAFEGSRINRALVEAATRLEDVTFHDLYEEYPDLAIDVAREQQLLSEHEVIVMQHPFYWYSTPAIIKEWFDLVLQHGWAYGSGGTALEGKRFLTATTTGGTREAYCPAGHNCYSMLEFLRPIEQTARLCGMSYEEPFVVHGALTMGNEDSLKEARRYVERLQEYANSNA